MKIEEALFRLNNYNHKYLIIGFKPDGIKGRPVTYEEFIDTAKSDTGVVGKIQNLTRFRVFNIGEEPFIMEEWIETRNKKEAEKTENEERELLETLKKKYENK